jgi:hypothetical protein
VDAVPHPEHIASGGQEKEDLGGSNTPPFTACTKTEKSALIFPAVPVHQKQLLLVSNIFDIHDTIPTSYYNRVLLFSQSTHFLRRYGCFLSSGLCPDIHNTYFLPSRKDAALDADLRLLPFIAV